MSGTATSWAYAIYLTSATGSQPIGTVVNRVMWDGQSDWSPDPDQAAIADPTGAYPIGSVYTPPAASS